MATTHKPKTSTPRKASGSTSASRTAKKPAPAPKAPAPAPKAPAPRAAQAAPKSNGKTAKPAAKPAPRKPIAQRPSESELHARIAQRAYELSVQRGFENGNELDDWLRAEREVMESLSR